MTVKKFAIFFLMISLTLPGLLAGDSGRFKLEKVSERIRFLTDTLDGTSQLALITENGVVIFDSFWSADTALRFKKGWEETLGRKDFVYAINTVDRIDIFGGNSIYQDIPIVGHHTFREKFTTASVDRELKGLINMWRWKEDVARKRLPTHPKGSKKERIERNWIHTCKQRADELEKSFSLVLPTITYGERMALWLGNTTMELIWFGESGFSGMTLVRIPEEKTALVPGFILHPQHFAPHPNPRYTKLNVPKWIRVLSGLLEGKEAVDKVVINAEYIWSRERALTHLNYIRKLWSRVKALENEGKTLEEVQKICSIDGEFSFFKDIQVYRDSGDEWSRPQHEVHVLGFYLQLKSPEYAKKKLEELKKKGK